MQQARTGSYRLEQACARIEQARTGLCKNRTDSNRLEQACARIEQGDDKVAVTWGSWGRTVQARTGLCKNRTVLCKNRTGGGGHGEESNSLVQEPNRLEQSCARTEQVLGSWRRIEQSCARTEQVVVVMEENRSGSIRLV